MKPSILLLLAILGSHLTAAQMGIKAAATYTHKKANESTSSRFAANTPSLVYFFKENRYFEVGFDALKVSKDKFTSGPTFSNYETAVAPFFEYGFIKGKPDARLKFKIGAKATLNNSFSGNTPRSSSEFQFSTYESTITLAVKPGLFYAVSDKLYLDFVVPITLLNGGYYRSNLENPAIPIRQQQQASLRNTFFPEIYQASLGLIYRPG